MDKALLIQGTEKLIENCDLWAMQLRVIGEALKVRGPGELNNRDRAAHLGQLESQSRKLAAAAAAQEEACLKMAQAFGEELKRLREADM